MSPRLGSPAERVDRGTGDGLVGQPGVRLAVPRGGWLAPQSLPPEGVDLVS